MSFTTYRRDTTATETKASWIWEPPPEVLIEGPVRKIHPIVYDYIDESLILKAAMLTKGGSAPSGLDADG